MDLFARFSNSFGKTTEGNKAILRFKIAKAERDIELAKLSRKLKKSGRTSEEIRLSLEDYLDQNDLSGLLAMPDRQDPVGGTQSGGIKFLGFE